MSKRYSRPFIFTTFNLRGFPVMEWRKVRHDIERVAGRSHAYFWQEQWTDWYRRRIRAQIPSKGHFHMLPNGVGGTGVTVQRDRLRTRWTFNHLLHHAIPGVCAERWITGMVATDRDTGEDVVLISVHPTPSAFSHRFRGRKKRQVRDTWFDGMREHFVPFIEHHVRMGRPIVVGGDFNARRRTLRKLLKHIDGVKIRTHKIDHIIFVDGRRYRWDITRGPRLVRRVYSDHNPLVVNARLARK